MVLDGMRSTLHLYSHKTAFEKGFQHVVAVYGLNKGGLGTLITATGKEPGADVIGVGERSPYNGLAPEAPPVLQPPDTPTGPVTHSAPSTHGQVPLQPLMGHGHLQREGQWVNRGKETAWLTVPREHPLDTKSPARNSGA